MGLTHNKSICSFYYEKNEAGLKKYFRTKNSFAGFVGRYKLEPVIDFPGIQPLLVARIKKYNK